MVTGYARIKLYSIIDDIEQSSRGSVLYFDTDSVIFKDGPDVRVPAIGDFLGDMTDEVAKDYGPNAFIDRFASGGPKKLRILCEHRGSHQICYKNQRT